MGISVSSTANDAIAHESDGLDLILSVLPQLRKWISRISVCYERSDSRRQLLPQIFSCTLTLGDHLQHWQAKGQVEKFRCEIAELATCIDHILDNDDLKKTYAAWAPSHPMEYSNLRLICNTTAAETDPQFDYLIKRLSDKNQDHWAELLCTLTKLDDRLQHHQNEDWVPEESSVNLPDAHTDMSHFVNRASTALICEHPERLGSDLMLKLETYRAMEITKPRSLCLLLGQSNESVKWREIYVHSQEEHVLQKNGTDTSPCVCEFLEEYATEPAARIDIGLRRDTLQVFWGEPKFDTPEIKTNYTVDLNGLLLSAQNLTMHTKWTLAIRFAYGLLYLYESSKDKNIWTKNNLVFFGDLDPDPSRPFFRISATTDEVEHLRSKLIFHRCSESLNLGIMLLELQMGKTIDNYLNDGKEIKTTNEAFLRAWKVFKEVEATIESGPYRNAIKACLHNRTFADVDQDFERWRKILHRSVIQPLEMEMTRSFESVISVTTSRDRKNESLRTETRSSVHRARVTKTVESQTAPTAQRTLSSLSPSPKAVKFHNTVSMLSSLKENMLRDDFSKHLGLRSIETLTDARTPREVVPVDPVCATEENLLVGTNMDSNEFATVLDDQELTLLQTDPSKISRAKKYLESLKTFNNTHLPNSTTKSMSMPEHMIRICVIDTGLNLSDSLIKGNKNRVLAGKSWVDEDIHDNCGHGTHISRLILGNTNSTCLLVAKVTNDKKFHDSTIANIVEAIKWALLPDQDAHIISLSLGFHENIPEIEKAIRTAIESPALVFAAAGNWGLNRRTAFPGSQKGVFCINASDGNGSFDSINPDEMFNGSYTTLGVAIPSRCEGNDVYITGTSFATPIAAAIAATMLNFARHKMNLESRYWQLLVTYQGMRKVLDLISAGQNKYLTLARLQDRGCKTSEDIGRAIKNALDVG